MSLPDKLELIGRGLALLAHEATSRKLALEARLVLLSIALWANVAVAPTSNVDLLSGLEDPGLSSAIFLSAIVEGMMRGAISSGSRTGWWMWRGAVSTITAITTIWRRSRSFFRWGRSITSVISTISTVGNGHTAQAKYEKKGEQVGITHD